MIKSLEEIFYKYVPKEITLNENINFVKDLNLDSFEIMNLIVDIEDFYKISLSIDSLINETNHTIKGLSSLINEIISNG